MSKNLPLGPAGSAPKSETPPPWWCRTLTLAAVIFAAILLNNQRFIFHSVNHEMHDLAANSHQVLQIKEFHNVLGHFCRFGFYNPGPAFFYFYAAGEALFFDALHLVPTPFNAQFIALYAFSAFFFSATLSVICRRLATADRKWFLGLALLLAAWHFGAVGGFYGRQGFFDIWPPHVLALPFLCFLVAGASVASGGGKDLPLMTLAGCFLAHGYACMALFVVLIPLVAYGGLLQHWRSSRSKRVAWPWQVFPRQHWLAGAIIALFLVPIVIDVVTATPNNLRLIFDHVSTAYGEPKGPLRSILYFLHYGAYTPYPNSNSIPAFETFDAQGTLSFFRTHWRAYGLWLIAIVVPIILVKDMARLRRRNARTENDHLTAIAVKAFLLRVYVVLCAAVVLTIVWGHFLEGPMYYYISTFNFAIYYGFALIFAITAALWIERRAFEGLESSTSYSRNWRRWLKIVGPILIAFAAVATFAHEARRFRSPSPNQDQQRLFATSIERALKMDSIQPKLLRFEGQAWGEAAGVALYLRRAGCSWYVADYAPSIPLIFGRDRAIPDKETDARVPNASIWRIVSPRSASFLEKEGFTVLRLAMDVDLVIKPDLRDKAQIEK
jgi:hypothetical protein